MSANNSFILGNLIDEAQFMGGILGYVCNEVGTVIFISFRCDALKFFAADTAAKKLVVDGGVMDRYEMVGLEET
jgi:protein-disulfide isomerase